MSKPPLLHQPVRQVLGSLHTLWPGSLEFISVVTYSYSISTVRPLMFNQAGSLP